MKPAAKVDGFGHRRSARRTHAATDTKVQWTTRAVASILSHAVTEVGKLSQEFDVVCLAGGVAGEAIAAGLRDSGLTPVYAHEC
jgi:hypothetical protein